MCVAKLSHVLKYIEYCCIARDYASICWGKHKGKWKGECVHAEVSHAS